MRAIKKLGQNFLTDKRVISKIISSLDIQKGDTILEIGPGKGIITKEILKKTDDLIIIEKDSRLINDLKKLSPSKKFKVIEGDIRDILESITKNIKNYKIIGNIPYYLTGYIFRLIQKLKNPPKSIVFVVQKEVASRISVSNKENKNQLAMIISLWAKPKIVSKIRRDSFSPKPKVDSAILRLEVVPKNKREKNEDEIIDLIKLGFRHPRKTIFNNLRGEYDNDFLEKVFKNIGWDKKVRAEYLKKEDWLVLSNAL